MGTTTILAKPIALTGFAPSLDAMVRLLPYGLEVTGSDSGNFNFGGSCIMQVWHHGSTVRPCQCPLCRRQITLLVPTEQFLRQRYDPEVAEVLRNIEAYNRMFGGQATGLVQRMQDLPFLLRRLLRELMDPSRTLPLAIKARFYIAAISSAVYILSPVDIIPEAILGIFGLLDDLLVALICFLYVASVYRSVLYFRHGGSRV